MTCDNPRTIIVVDNRIRGGLDSTPGRTWFSSPRKEKMLMNIKHFVYRIWSRCRRAYGSLSAQVKHIGSNMAVGVGISIIPSLVTINLIVWAGGPGRAHPY